MCWGMDATGLWHPGLPNSGMSMWPPSQLASVPESWGFSSLWHAPEDIPPKFERPESSVEIECQPCSMRIFPRRVLGTAGRVMSVFLSWRTAFTELL